MDLIHERPQYDPELAPLQAGFGPFGPITPDFILACQRDPSLLGPPPVVSELLRHRPFEHVERHAPGLANDDPPVPLAIFTPTTDSPSARPVIYYMHGGGMIFLNRYADLERPLDWAAATNSVLISVEYRLAGNVKQPALVNDCYAGLMWVSENALELGIDTSRIMIAGHSGGSALAAGLALMARDKNGPAICAQMLASPMLDDRSDTISCHQFDDVQPWGRRSNIAAWQAVLGDSAGCEDVSEYFAPIRAVNMRGLPPTWIDVGSADAFRDEAVTYATKCWAAGVQAELHVWPGGFHGFDIIAPSSRLALQASAIKMEWVQRLLS